MNETATRPITILWLRGKRAALPQVLESLGRVADVRSVSTVEEAMELLRQQPYDLVINDSDVFLPLGRLHFANQAATALEAMAQGVCLIGPAGQMIWANPKMLSLSADIQSRVQACCGELFTRAGADNGRRPAAARARRFTLTTETKECFELTATPIVDVDQRVTQVAAVVWDATNTYRLQEKIDAIDRAGRELVNLDAEQIARLDMQERLALLEQKIIRYTHDLLHFDNFAIRLLDKKTNRLELVLASGMSAEGQELDLFACPDGNGICGYVAHHGRSYICPDVQADARYMVGIVNARSSLTVPLRLHDQVIGVFNVESDRPAAFGENDRQFLEIFGRYVAVALHVLNLLVTERYAVTGSLAGAVLAELTGPVNDILTDVGNLTEDYIGHDDLRHRLNKIAANAVAIREVVKQYTTQQGVIGRRPHGATRHDPILTGKHVLIADDEEVIRDTVRDVLAGYGCEVAIATTGDAAIEMLKRAPFDLVISDIRMPNRSGYEVFAAAKDANPNTPVILMTGFGYDPNHSIVRARREGLAAVLFKPFKVDQLLSEIRSALRSASAPTPTPSPQS
ncbi:MAG TPA: response regulator [Phycisphaerae bacterium]|jgi:CheY-like chemotaxis protein